MCRISDPQDLKGITFTICALSHKITSSNGLIASIDALCQRLGIQHPLDQSTCIGYGQRKPTCGLLAAESSRMQALSLLDQISHDLSRGSPISNDALQTVAGLLLCRRWHQFQAYEIAQRWQARLEKTTAARWPERATVSGSSNSVPQYSTRYPARYATPLPPQPPFQYPIQLAPQYPQQYPIQNASQYPTPVYIPPQPSLQQVTNEPGLRSCTTQELITEIQTRLRSSTDTYLLTAILDIVGTRSPSPRTEPTPRDYVPQSNAPAGNPSVTSNYVPRDIGFRDMETANVAPPQPAPPRLRSAARQQIEVEANPSSPTNPGVVSAVTKRNQASTRRPAPISDDIRQARITALTSTRRSPAPEPPARAPSPLRSSYMECGVCMEPYEDEEDNHWECQNCLNRAHARCFESWRSAPSARGVRCMYCRVEVTQ